MGDEGGASGVTAGRIGTTTVPVDMWGFFPKETPGAIRVVQNIPGVAGISGSGYLAEVHFRVIGTRGVSTTITLQNGVLSDKNAKEIAANWMSSSVRVAEKGAAIQSPVTSQPTGSVSSSPGSSQGASAPSGPPAPASGPAPSDAPRPPAPALSLGDAILSFVESHRVWLILGLAGAAILTLVIVLLRKATARD